MFDEAYFLVRRDFEKRGEREIVREAERIIDENTTRRRETRGRYGVLLFSAGAFTGALFTLLLLAIANVL